MAAIAVLAIVVVFVVLAVTVPTRTPRSGDDSDPPGRIATAAVNRLLADRGDWGRAMLAELAHVDRRVHRWRFAAGIVRVALFPPFRRARMVVVAVAGLVVTAAAAAAAARAVPSLSLFAAVLGLLLCGYAIVAAARPPRRPRTPAQVTVIEIIGALMLFPVVLLVCGLVGAIAGDGVRWLTMAGGRLGG
jgi:hypothetical protein